MMEVFLFRTPPRHSGVRLIAGPFKAHSNRAFRCIALANPVDAAMKIRVKLFCGRTVERRD
jgi:hypothetical protein